MSAEFLQEYLDRLRQVYTAELFDPALSQKERTDRIKLARQQLKAVRRSVRDRTDAIKRQWDGRKSDEKIQEDLHLAQYAPLLQLLDQLELSISELEIKGAEAEQITFGGIYVGDFESGEWLILEVDQSLIWLARKAKRTISNFQQDIHESDKRIASWQDLIGDHEKRIRSQGPIVAAVVVIVLSVCASILAGVAMYTNQALQDPGIIIVFGAAMAVVFISGIVSVVETANRRKKLRREVEYLQTVISSEQDLQEHMKSDLNKAKSILTGIKQEYVKLKQITTP